MAKPMSKDEDKEPAGEERLNAVIYAELRRRLVTGKITPGHALSTRTLAHELGVSQTPVRDALSRLAAEGAVQIRSKKRIIVPPMTPERFEEVLRCRLLLEPEAAAIAAAHIDEARLNRLKAIDDKLDKAIANGDPDAYVTLNHAFHFELYNAGGRGALCQLIEMLWLQFGPHMRHVYGRWGTAHLVDQHHVALDCIAKNDVEGVRAAIAADIADGMGIIGRSALAEADAPSK
jgi:DNA-binding GntR family transcriptional regulator